MGADQSIPAAAVVPHPEAPPNGLWAFHPGMQTDREQTFLLPEHLDKMNYFEIKEARSSAGTTTWFRVKSCSGTLESKKVFMDARHPSITPVMIMKSSGKVWHGTGYEQQKKGEPLLRVTSDWGMLRAPEVVNQATGQTVALHVDFPTSNAAVISIGKVEGIPVGGMMPVAKVQWTKRGRNPFAASPKNGYLITIAPGVDVALIIIMCISLDNMRYSNQDD